MKKRNYGDKTKDASIVLSSIGDVFTVNRPRWKRKKPPGKQPLKVLNRSNRRVFGALERTNRRAFVAGVKKTWYNIKKQFKLIRRR